jgi:hypothetical protein
MNLIVAMSANYGVPQLRNFVRSFKKHQKNDVLLLLQNTDAATKDWLRQQDVLTVDVEMGIHSKFARYYTIAELLQLLPQYTRIFHCDVRDAVAQDDIFAQIPDPGLHVFLEDSTLPIGQNPVNSAWMLNAYGEEILARHADKTVICSGTTLGDRESFLACAQAMTEEFERVLARQYPDPVLRHGDQVLHIHLVYSGQLADSLAQIGKPLVLHKNGDGVITMGKAREFLVSKNFLVCNPDKSVPAVVHQYDRHEFLQKGFDALYAEN